MLLRWPERRHWESVRGLVQRYAAANAFASIDTLAALLSERTGQQLSDATSIARSPAALQALANLSGRPSEDLTSRAWEQVSDVQEPYLRFEGVVLQDDAVLLGRQQLCTACLEEAPYIRADWDLTHVVACARHRCLLAEACPTCQARFSANRPFTGHCHVCGQRLKASRLVAADTAVIDASEDAAGLADIRLTNGSRHALVSPASFFSFVRFGCHAASEHWTGVFRKVRLNALTVQGRAAALMWAGRCRRPRGYDSAAVCQAVEKHFPHLAGLDRFDWRKRRVAQSLIKSGLDVDFRNFVLYGNRLGDEEARASHLEGRSAAYTTPSDVAKILGVSAAGMAWLRHQRLLTDPVGGNGFSTYEVLDCGRFLAELVPATFLDNALGAENVTAELGRHGVLDLWDVEPGREARASLWSVIRMLDRLRHATEGSDDADLESVASLVKGMDRAGEATLVIRVVLGLLMGQISGARWTAPWRLVDIRVSAGALRRLESSN